MHLTRVLLVLVLACSGVSEELVPNDSDLEGSLVSTTTDGDELYFPTWSRIGEEETSTAASSRLLKSESCGGHSNCTSCYESSLCHWCAHDKKCHSLGSPYGCWEGASCEKADPKPDDSCSTYDTCSKCGATYTCHWCAHDESCHTIGSIYGCVSGVDCYSNDRCKRTEPEILPPSSLTDVGMFPMVSILVVAGFLFCCSSLCMCCVNGVKEACDDLAATTFSSSDSAAEVVMAQPAPEVVHVIAPRISTTSGNDDDDDDDDAVQANALPPKANGESTGERTGQTLEGTSSKSTTDGTDACTAPGSALEDSGHVEEFFYGDEEEEPIERYPLLSSNSRPSRTRAVKHVRKMYCLCTLLYVVVLTAIGGAVYGTFYFYPRYPDYSVCNDQVAWKSLVDSMTSMKVTANFEILMSFSNPNNFDIVLDLGRGDFSHHGAPIGTFTVPSVEARASAITDLMIIAEFSPEKWDALSLTSEYYLGKLVLTLDAELDIRVPLLANYSTEIKIQNQEIDVNGKADLHLCKCKKWHEASMELTDA